MPGFLKTTALAAMGSRVLAELSSTNPDLADFAVYDPSFLDIVGNTASIELIYNATEPLFHEGGVYNATGDTLYVSSNRIPLPVGQADESTSNQTIKLHAVTNVSAGLAPSNASSPITLQALDTSTINLPNGGVAHAGSPGILFTAQGSKTAAAGIFRIADPLGAPNTSEPVVTSFQGRPFNSPNDVAVNAADGGTIWFTDPSYGASQGIRAAARLPNHVYRHDPAANTTRVVADGFQQPNGLAFDAGGGALFVTDANADPAANPAGPATIYKFDVVYDAPGTFLANKRVFAFAPEGIPDGIKVDAAGNVWSGTGSGVAVWNEAGDLIGQIAVKGGAANFGFGETEKTVFVLGEKLLWRVRLDI